MGKRPCQNSCNYAYSNEEEKKHSYLYIKSMDFLFQGFKSYEGRARYVLSMASAGNCWQAFIAFIKKRDFHNSLSLIIKIFTFIMLFISCKLLFISNANAFKFTPQICKEYNLGKNWYCEVDTESSLSANDILNSNLSPTQKAIQLNELWEMQRKIAVITEKREDDERFLETQFIIAQKGVGFARRIQNIIESNPRFSGTQSYYKNISDQAIHDAEKQEILASANKRYGLVFIYNSECPHCVRQYPIILHFKSTYGFKVLGISTDEGHFDGLDENITNPAPDVPGFPAIFLLDKQNPAKIFISNGLITLDDLEERIVNRIQERDAKDN